MVHGGLVRKARPLPRSRAPNPLGCEHPRPWRVGVDAA